MAAFIPHIYTFILPLFVGNLLHMVIVKRNLLAGLAVPLSLPLFGAGKTYRAFVVLPVICGIASLFFRVVFLQETNLWWSFAIGFILGIVYLLGELPNSYIKRRLGIGAGQLQERFRWLQYVVDKTDSLVPMCMVYYFLVTITLPALLLLFVVSFLIHVTFSWVLYRVRIKKSF